MEWEIAVTLATLICFPFAGGGAGYFQGWQKALEGSFDVYPVSLPGRERRLLEPPCLTVDAAVNDTLQQCPRELLFNRRIVVFGHCLGAFLASAFAVRLQKDCGFYVQQLIASGSPSPHKSRAIAATGLGDEAFLARVREFSGLDDPAMQDPEWRELIIPTLRADVEMHERHRSDAALPDTRTTVVRGSEDHLVSHSDLLEWKELTDRPIDVVTLPGGHMYLTESPEPLFQLLRSYAR